MKKIHIFLLITAITVGGFLIIAADHVDAPAVAGGGSDITDFYAFQGEDTDNIVFVANVRGLLSPSDTRNATFDEDLMIEINIDTDNDLVEDLVIQAVPKNKKMYFHGPVVPNETGLESTFQGQQGNEISFIKITEYGESPRTKTTKDGMKIFAGPRDDPFFFDFAQYQAILGGAGGFNDPGTDFFAGTNVLSVVIEVPKSMIGGSGFINSWVESKRKQ